VKGIAYFLFIALCLVCSCKNDNAQANHSSQPDKPPKEINHTLATEENHSLEDKYKEMLKPIVDLKSSDPDIYWFIVSWLDTNYKTPDWKGYGTGGWQEKTKVRGIDCSGFARVMQDQLFGKKIRGGSQGILDHYCTRKSTNNLELGDLLFFRAPYSKNDNIVHIGIYLMDQHFVHATSFKSASKGYGLMINSLDEENWVEEFVVAGRVKTFHHFE